MSSKTKEAEKSELDPALSQGTKAVTVASAYEEDAGSGFENMDATFFKIPFYSILQKGSPEVDEDSSERMEGAKAGMLLHSVTKALMDGKEKGIAVVPLHVEKRFMEWIPRTQGGGLVAVYAPNDPKVLKLTQGHSEFDKITTEDGNELKMTFNVFCLVIRDDGTTEPVVLGMTSSNIGPFKEWMGLSRGITAKNDQGKEFSLPLYSHVYRLKTKFNENKKGTWYGWNIGFEGGSEESSLIAVNSDLYRAAKEFRAMVVSGQATADTDSMSNDAQEESGKEAF
jgi:hypothetical protein